MAGSREQALGSRLQLHSIDHTIVKGSLTVKTLTPSMEVNFCSIASATSGVSNGVLLCLCWLSSQDVATEDEPAKEEGGDHNCSVMLDQGRDDIAVHIMHHDGVYEDYLGIAKHWYC